LACKRSDLLKTLPFPVPATERNEQDDTIEQQECFLHSSTENESGSTSMSKVRQLIERLAGTEEQRQFARDSERFGDDLEQTWTENENGADLLWLAAAVGVVPKQIVATACELLEGVIEQTTTVRWEITQVLESIHAWERDEQSVEQVGQVGWNAYQLIADLEGNPPLPPDVDNVINAVVWLTEVVGESPPKLPDELYEQGVWCFLDHLAQALALHQDRDGIDADPADVHQRAYAGAMRHFAITIRRRITGVEVQQAAQQRGIWTLC
jgi:hypothetical protein